jgi:signal transduction histidine kinase/ligand-binding sensor domain-containing protein
VLSALLAVAFCGASSRGASPGADDRFSIRVWQVEDGLPSDKVLALAQTPDGFLWVGTAAGLARFDGKRFGIWREPQSIADQRIETLFTDRSGSLWVGTSDGRLFRLQDGKLGELGTEAGWADARIQSIGEDKEGAVWMATGTGGLLRFHGGRFQAMMPETQERGAVTSLAAETAGNRVVWIQRSASIGFLNGTNSVEVRPPGTVPLRMGAMTPRRSGGLWLFSGTSLDVLQDGLWSGVSRPYPKFMDPYRLLEDSHGHLWIATTQQGLVCLAPDNGVTRFYTGTGFPTDFPTSLLEDRDGNLWVGTPAGGLVRLSRRTVSTVTVPERSWAAPLCVAGDVKGTIWAGFGEIGLYRCPPNGMPVPVEPKGRPFATGWALHHGRNGRTWYAAYGWGLYSIRGDEVQLWGAREGLPSNDIHALAEDSNGRLWVGGVSGLSRFDGDGFVNITVRDGLPASPVHALVLEASGAVWAGTSGKGLVRWNEGRTEVFTTKHGLPSDDIRSLLPGDGSLWIGTARGLCFWDGDKLRPIPESAGLPRREIAGMVDDRQGNLWLATHRGLLRVARGELEAAAEGRTDRVIVRRVGLEDGMPGLRMSAGQPCAVRAHDGRLWFATLKGLAVIDPRDVRTNEPSSRVYLEEVLVDGVPLAARADLANARPVRVPPGSRHIEFRYTTANLTTPERVRFQRRLEGFDDAWQEAGTEGTVAYHGLRSGSYRLRVRASNGDGVWSDRETAVTFDVAPSFWETRGFRGGMAALLMLGIGGTFHWRTRTLEQRRANQERFSRQLMAQQEAERRRVAAELHDSLGQTLSIIRNRAALAVAEGDAGPRSNAHVADISSAASEALTSVREICQGLLPVELDRVGLTKTLRAVAERVGSGAGLETLIEIDPVDDLVAREDWIHILRILQEALNNILKHAKAGQLTVTLREDDECLRLVVADNGSGFDPRIAAQGRSLGLSTMEERARILGATLRLDSAPGRGSTVRLDVPTTRRPTISWNRAGETIPHD